MTSSPDPDLPVLDVASASALRSLVSEKLSEFSAAPAVLGADVLSAEGGHATLGELAEKVAQLPPARWPLVVSAWTRSVFGPKLTPNNVAVAVFKSELVPNSAAVVAEWGEELSAVYVVDTVEQVIPLTVEDVAAAGFDVEEAAKANTLSAELGVRRSVMVGNGAVLTWCAPNHPYVCGRFAYPQDLARVLFNAAMPQGGMYVAVVAQDLLIAFLPTRPDQVAYAVAALATAATKAVRLAEASGVDVLSPQVWHARPDGSVVPAS